jgi:hypothetical protein
LRRPSVRRGSRILTPEIVRRGSRLLTPDLRSANSTMTTNSPDSRSEPQCSAATTSWRIDEGNSSCAAPPHAAMLQNVMSTPRHSLCAPTSPILSPARHIPRVASLPSLSSARNSPVGGECGRPFVGDSTDPGNKTWSRRNSDNDIGG